MIAKSRSEGKKNNTVYYFTGKPCKHGHVDFRYTKGGCCQACNTANKKKYKEQIKKTMAVYYIKNKEKITKYSRQYQTTLKIRKALEDVGND